MFTLCGLILEARENLFKNFWSSFSISFYFSSERNNLKKTNRPNGPCPTRTPGPVAFISRGEAQPKPNPSPSPELPPPPARAARRRRTPPTAAAARRLAARGRLEIRAAV